MSDDELAEAMAAVLAEIQLRHDNTNPLTPEREAIEHAAFEFADAIVKAGASADAVVQMYWWN